MIGPEVVARSAEEASPVSQRRVRAAAAVLVLAGLAVLSAPAWSADYRLPRPTGLTVTNAVFECTSPGGCTVAVACTTDHAVDFEDYDFLDEQVLDEGGIHQTRRQWRTNEACVARVVGSTRVTGLRYLKLKARDGTMHFAGVAEVPVQRFDGTATEVDGGAEQQPFVVVLVDARLVMAAPAVDMAELARLTHSVLGQMGFVENEDYRILQHDHTWDITDAAADVLSEGSSGPATDRFRKSILEATSYAVPRGHGLVYVGGVSEWPTGRDHGSYMLAGPDVQFVSFCNGTAGFLTCSVKEDCLGHELGHAFGMLHERHNWYGFAPTQDHRDAMWRMTRCAPESDRPNDVWSDETLRLIRAD